MVRFSGRGKVKKFTGEFERKNSSYGLDGSIKNKVGVVESGNKEGIKEEGGGGGSCEVLHKKQINCNHEEVSKLVEEMSVASDSKIRSTSYGATIVQL